MNPEEISGHIKEATGKPFTIVDVKQTGGGCINRTCRLIGTDCSYFLKLNRKSLLSMFEAEFAGLQEMAHSATVRVPCPIVHGISGEECFLVLEMVEFGRSSQHSDQLLGRQLAQMHRQTKSYFGWERDNTIGSTTQLNNSNQNWVEFWRQQRLGFQLQLAAQNGYSGRLQRNGERLCDELHHFFSDYQPQPALLHGDLWGGNAASDQQGQPVIFDPACYYGDHEADLAMTELFGGFSASFYAAYQEVQRIDAGYASRKTLYNLYHILNHLNLFGGGYLSQAEHMINALLAEI